MIVQFRFRRGTAAEWVAANPILAAGEPGLDTTSGSFKIGNGVAAWNDLGSQTYSPEALSAALTEISQKVADSLANVTAAETAAAAAAASVASVQRGVANGVAGLDSAGDVINAAGVKVLPGGGGGGGTGSANVALDTDGVPYYDATGLASPQQKLLLDTDSVPYYTAA